MRACALRFGLTILVLNLFACTPSLDRESAAIRRAMASLIYVGEDQDGPRIDTILGPGSHNTQAKELPKRLEEGRRYIFHRRKANENSWVILERDLRANGATIIEGPEGDVGLVYTYIGGPFFVIRFRLKRYRGTIQNFMANPDDLAKMTQDVMPEDFLLTVDSIDYK
jgi:hypothetical protein